MRTRWSSLTAMTAMIVAQKVESIVGAMMPLRFFAPCALRRPITSVGSTATPVVLIARNVHIASVATPFLLLSLLSSTIARRPKGVAALERPSMLADRFKIIADIAG